MQILNSYIDPAGKYRYTCLLSDGTTVQWKFNEEKTLIQLESLEPNYLDIKEYMSITPIKFNILDHVIILKEFIQLVKDNPSVTLTQYNNWLATQSWYNASIIRYFVFTMAMKLSERNEVSLSNLTESEVLLRVRNWIVNTSLQVIAKVVGYNG